MAQLDGRRVLIAGGAGEVGEGVVRAFLKRGATVIVPSRSEEKLVTLDERIGEQGLDTDRLFELVTDTTSEEGLADLRDKIERNHGALYGVVVSLGGWWQGADLPESTLEDWHRVVEGGLTAHYLFAKTFIPVLARNPGSSYTMVNGGAALQPMPKSGLVSIVALAQIMMKDVLAYENKGRVRVNTLLLATPIVTRSRQRRQDNWLTADEAGEYAAWLASRGASHLHGETIHFRDREQLNALEW